MYLANDTPWDTGFPSTELGLRLAAGEIPPGGGAVDLGCGTGTNGIYLAVLAAQLAPPVPAIVMSGFDDPVLVKEASNLKARFLTKPLSRDQLLAAILSPDDQSS